MYKFTEGSRLSGDAEKVGVRLNAIRKEHGGALKPPDVVEDARDARSPLHHYFEWNNGRAADAYRLEQARHLIRHIVVVLKGDNSDQPIRAFMVVKEEEEGGEEEGHSYHAIADILGNPKMRAQVVARALAEHESWESRYRHLNELALVFSAAEKTRKKLGQKQMSMKEINAEIAQVRKERRKKAG